MKVDRARAVLERTLPEWVRYGLALAITGLCLALRWHLSSYLAATTFLPFFLGVLVAARLLGRGPAILTTLSSAVAAAYYFVPPYGAFHVAVAAEAIPVVIFIAVGVFTTELVERLNGANKRLRHQMGATERARAELAKVSAQRELLLEEINHRIKNHLQSVAGLAGMSARRLKDLEDGRGALLAFEARLQVLARVYDRLRLTGSEATLDAKPFFQGMCSDLRTSIIGTRPVTIRAVIEDAKLSADEAALLGLIGNELISNALKYAFPDGRAGTVSLEFTHTDSEGCLTISDDGVGLSSEVQGSGSGSRLVQSLARQLGGEAVWGSASGTSARVCFPLRPHI
jgi:two-component sensor histidine kinase